MIKQLSTTKDADAIFALSQFAFQYTLSAEAFEHKKQEAERHIIWGWMSDDELAAKVHLIPLSCYINGKPFAMGGVSSVATWPEYRRQGLVRKLLHHALTYMRQNGQTLSFLHPFSYAFYRKYGWEHAFSQKQYSLPVTSLKRKWDTTGCVRRIDWDIHLLHDIYTEYAKCFNGTLVRDAKWWEERVLQDNWHKAVAYSADGTAEGYILYKATDKKLIVHEMVYNTLNARMLLLQFIANHDSMAETVEMIVPENDNLALLLDEPSFEQKISPYFMARIIDVSAFLKHYPFQQGRQVSIALHIDDEFLPENDGVYQLRQTGSEINVTRLQSDTQSQKAIYCNVQYLTSMMLGFKRPNELYDAGLIHGEQDAVKQLDIIIPGRQTFFPDFF
ncbi:GNAT family N-acetyltransferase [Lentibacillus cibarius]|uniref:GNAT family N-acetyltransferase n=1 Tax=Lentibacillus cibarius TaxID=2583219 RepID=A0A5S3QKH0_9BACI|nr:GNAT family N-acetyltransferase [Lentibacillus cibarius]TMN22412.1 GNAT family N-acetyltransferase [Lentibacillus cibarius]